MKVAILSVSAVISALGLGLSGLLVGLPIAAQEPAELPANPPAAAAIPKGVQALMQRLPGRFHYTDFVKQALATRLAPRLAPAVAAARVDDIVAAPEILNAEPTDVEQAVLTYVRQLSGTTPPPDLADHIKKQNAFADQVLSAGALRAPSVGAAQKANVLTGDVLGTNLTHFDWRDLGWVVKDSGIISEAKDQTNNHTSSCGCCWAFGTVGTFEGADALMNLRLINGSEQNLLDCVGPLNGVANNCSGGWWAFDYIINNGLATEKGYPYAGVQQGCLADSVNRPYHAVTWKYVLNQSDIPRTQDQILQIKSALTQFGPVAATLYATTVEFSGYDKTSPPIKSFPSGNKVVGADGVARIVDHAIVIVGWNNSKQAWAIKNSWGVGWGDQGFGYVDYLSNNIGFGAAYVTPVSIAAAGGVAATSQVPAPVVASAPALESITLPLLFPPPPSSVNAAPPAVAPKSNSAAKK